MKRLIGLILFVAMLSGCALARGGTAGADELVGFLVIAEEDQSQVRQTIHADPETLEFPVGVSFFTYEGQGRTNKGSPEISVEQMEYSPGDVSRYEMEGVLYVPQGMETTIWVSVIYQTPDGELYAQREDEGGYVVEGGTDWSLIRNQNYPVDRGYTTYEGSRVTLSFRTVTLPECYVLIEMNAQDEVLCRTEYIPGELPEIYTPGSDAAYLILEARTGEQTLRTIYSPDDETKELEVYRPGYGGFCIRGGTAIDWEG